MKNLPLFLLLMAISNSPYVMASGDHNAESEHAEQANEKAQDDHDEHGHGDHGEHGEEGVITLSKAQMQEANIQVKTLQLQTVSASIHAAGEVMLNAYRTVQVTPRIAAQVMQRHARLGDMVKKGQPLVTLSSVEMANAQGQLQVSFREWQRVKKLGRKVVSARRYIEAKVNWDQAHARARAYGMTEVQIKALLDGTNTAIADGQFQLVAQQAGRVLHDNFIVGQRVEPGYELMTVADESLMWVEAKLTPNDSMLVKAGNSARVIIGSHNLAAKVSQLNHALDEVTRTLAVRLEVKNPDDLLHPGMFVNTRIESSQSSRALVLPEAAVLRSPDGDWQVMVEQDEAGEFKPQEIELIQLIDGNAVIEGLKAGSRVVVQGAFFVMSELAKAGFEVHNH